MRARSHAIFNKSQYTVTIDLPDDVFFDLMALLKRINKAFAPYKITADDMFTMAIEDYLETYVENPKALVKRVTTIK